MKFSAVVEIFHGDAWLRTEKMKRPLIILLCIVALGAGLRLAPIVERPLWYDEAFTWYVAAPGSIHAWLRWESREPKHPPLSFALAWASMRIFQTNAPWALRLPSVLCGIGLIIAIYVLGALIRGPTTGLVAALLAALAPNMINQAQQARMFSMLALATVVALILAVAAARSVRDGRPSDALAIAIGGVLATMLWINQLALAVWAGLVLGLLTWAIVDPTLRLRSQWSRRLARPAALTTVVVIVLAGVGLASIARNLLSGTHTESAAAPGAIEIALAIGENLKLIVGNPWAGFVTFPLGAIGLWLLRRDDRPVFYLLAWVAIVSIVILFPFRAMHPFLAPRFLSTFEPVLWIAVATAITSLRPRTLAAAALAVVLISLGRHAGDAEAWSDPGRSELPRATAELAATIGAGESVVFQPEFNRIVGYYYGLPRNSPLHAALYLDPRVEREETIQAIDRPDVLWFVAGFTSETQWGRDNFAAQQAQIRAFSEWYGHEELGEEIARRIELGDTYLVRFDRNDAELTIKHRRR